MRLTAMDYPASTMLREPIIRYATTPINMSITERRLSVIGGIALGLITMRRRDLLSLPLAAASVCLLVQGITGESKINELLNHTTAIISPEHGVSVPHQQG